MTAVDQDDIRRLALHSDAVSPAIAARIASAMRGGGGYTTLKRLAECVEDLEEYPGQFDFSDAPRPNYFLALFRSMSDSDPYKRSAAYEALMFAGDCRARLARDVKGFLRCVGLDVEEGVRAIADYVSLGANPTSE